MLPLKDRNFLDTVITSVLRAASKVSEIKQTGARVSGTAYANIFHDTILAELISAGKGFSKGVQSNDLSYKGERWELKTSRTKKGCGINRINKFENVKLIIVNAIPENEEIYSIRLLEAKDECFTPENEKTQIRSITELGQRKAVQIHP